MVKLIDMSKKAKKNSTQIIRAEDYVGELGDFMKSYDYEPRLTPMLDQFVGPFTQDIIQKITLWKTDSYVELSSALLDRLNEVRALKQRHHREAEPLLEALIREEGVGLAMASTYLRFANPEVFQIIDRHAYRALTGKPVPETQVEAVLGRDTEKHSQGYFEYLDGLWALCDRKQLQFRNIDRILFKFDKKENPPLTFPREKKSTGNSIKS